MLNRHHLTIARLSAHHPLKYLIKDYFRLPIATALMPAMLAKGLGQADLVLCLLHIRDAHTGLRTAAEEHITALIGRAIHACPSCLQLYRAPSIAPTRTPNSRRVTHVVSRNPRQEGTDAHLRWHEFRVGRTIGQLVVRGITKRDIHRAARAGWIKLEEITA